MVLTVGDKMSRLNGVKSNKLWSGRKSAPFLYVFARAHLYKHPKSPRFSCSQYIFLFSEYIRKYIDIYEQ